MSWLVTSTIRDPIVISALVGIYVWGFGGGLLVGFLAGRGWRAKAESAAADDAVQPTRRDRR